MRATWVDTVMADPDTDERGSGEKALERQRNNKEGSGLPQT